MLNRFFELESRVDFSSVKIGHLHLWPFLRIYFGYQLIYDTPPATVDAKSFLKVLRTAFSGLFNVFGRYDYIYFSDSEQRRKIGEKYFDRFDSVTDILKGNSLFFENFLSKQYSSEEVPTSKRASRSLLYALEFILLKALFLKRVKGEEILSRVNRDFNLKINYRYFAHRYYAQYLIAKLLTRIYKPVAVFFITPYTNLGYLVGFKEAGVKVIEMQHGVINKQHLGYNPSLDFGSSYRPDYLLTFGLKELEVFGTDNYYVDHAKVRPVGSFYFEYIATAYGGDSKIANLKKKYPKVVAVSAEHDVEAEIFPIIIAAARKLPHHLFLYMPRNKKATDYQTLGLDNLVVTDWLNAYQVIWQSDVHTCVRSTTALEAIALGTQNILINHKNYARSYFEKTLNDESITMIVDTADQYIQALTTFNKISKKEIMRSSDNTIIPGFSSNLREEITKIFPV